MRIPKRKIYRAFPELDLFSDEQCERFMRRIEVSGLRKEVPRTGFLLAAGSTLFFGCFVSGIMLDAYYFTLIRSGDEVVKIFCILLGMLVFLSLPPMLGLLARDVLLRRNLRSVIHEKLDRIRCLTCRCILIGQVARDGRVTCPECGRVQFLGELGIVEGDLIPPVMSDPMGQSFV